MQLIDKYQPELIYFDDTVLPFYPLNDIGLQIAAHHLQSKYQTKWKTAGRAEWKDIECNANAWYGISKENKAIE
jgi:alpha-L-fucosidase